MELAGPPALLVLRHMLSKLNVISAQVQGKQHVTTDSNHMLQQKKLRVLESHRHVFALHTHRKEQCV